VREFAELEAVLERATIIMEMEQSMLPLMITVSRWRFSVVFRFRQAVAWLLSVVRRSPTAPAAAVTLGEAWKEKMTREQRDLFPSWLHVIKAGAERRSVVNGQTAGGASLGDESSEDTRQRRLENEAVNIAITSINERQERMDGVLRYIARHLHRAEQQGQIAFSEHLSADATTVGATAGASSPTAIRPKGAPAASAEKTEPRTPEPTASSASEQGPESTAPNSRGQQSMTSSKKKGKAKK
jgi:hypothetical protein